MVCRLKKNVKKICSLRLIFLCRLRIEKFCLCFIIFFIFYKLVIWFVCFWVGFLKRRARVLYLILSAAAAQPIRQMKIDWCCIYKVVFINTTAALRCRRRRRCPRERERKIWNEKRKERREKQSGFSHFFSTEAAQLGFSFLLILRFKFVFFFFFIWRK